MSFFGIPELDANMDGLLNMVDQLETVQQRMNDLTASATSEDEYITVTVDAKGQVAAIDLNPRVMRKASEDLAEELRETINQAHAALAERSQELMSELSGAAGIDLDTALNGTSNVKEAAEELIRIGRGDVTPEQANAAMRDATHRVTGFKQP
ncbi:YbaB/EbfC family nucleoid-associated protein [Actinopolymorpha rutila]|uniref:DNA-binding protein YbaB n=1 Tax=Actinopolymorpha rutila TaxID=446787 RepID=A0A852ZF65_9ACTN|nr:YbaB/EbfC family nucleoid-associated protein [Actinopolymorpha rutila]NYH87610.1 DNA-binding protein YbaB [Actinopolymorpha rutila]